MLNVTCVLHLGIIKFKVNSIIFNLNFLQKLSSNHEMFVKLDSGEEELCCLYPKSLTPELCCLYPPSQNWIYNH